MNRNLDKCHCRTETQMNIISGKLRLFIHPVTYFNKNESVFRPVNRCIKNQSICKQHCDHSRSAWRVAAEARPSRVPRVRYATAAHAARNTGPSQVSDARTRATARAHAHHQSRCCPVPAHELLQHGDHCRLPARRRRPSQQCPPRHTHAMAPTEHSLRCAGAPVAARARTSQVNFHHMLVLPHTSLTLEHRVSSACVRCSLSSWKGGRCAAQGHPDEIHRGTPALQRLRSAERSVQSGSLLAGCPHPRSSVVAVSEWLPWLQCGCVQGVWAEG